ncbi:hypothetical protein [Streptomyces flavofungini]|uniref:hypothetical protein n=1 Tax=Streptomyces flavofungini TaxID=68200 RepID=UPI0034DE3D62
MSDRLTSQRAAEIREKIASAIYLTYGQEDRNRSLAIADLVMPAVRKVVAAELAAVRAERDEARAGSVRLAGILGERDAELAALREEVGPLRMDAAKLRALHAAGVDNWEGYDEAVAR